MLGIGRVISSMLTQIHNLMRAGKLAQAQQVMRQLISIVLNALETNPGLISQVPTETLLGRMASVGFSSAEIEAAGTALTAAGEVELVAGTSATVGFFATEVMIAGVVVTMGELLAMILIIVIALGIIMWLIWLAVDLFYDYRNRQLLYRH